MRQVLLTLVRTIATAALIGVLTLPAMSATRRRAVAPVPAPLPAAVFATEVTAANYGSMPSVVQRCVDDQPCVAAVVNPGETKRYAQSGQVMRIGPIDAGTINIESDGLTLSRTAFVMSTKVVPGVYDLSQFSQTIFLISDHAGAVGLKSVGPNGTTQELVSVPYQRGITTVEPSTVFGNIDPNFQFEITDSVALAIEWRSRATGKVTRIPALRIEEAFTEAFIARVAPSTTIMVKNALQQQQGGVNFFFLPAAGATSLGQFGRGVFIQPYGMIRATDLAVLAGSSGEGSLDISGVPEGQELLPFFAWAITEGAAYPLTRFQQAATAHGTGPNFTPYQNLRWTGLRSDVSYHTELALQSMVSLPNTGILTLDDQGTPFLTQNLSFAGYGSQRVNLDALAGTHTLYCATLQMNDDPSTQYPNDTPRATGVAVVTTANGTNVRSPIVVSRANLVAKIPGEQYIRSYYDSLSERRFFLNNAETRCMLRGDCGVAGIRDDLAEILSRGIGETWTPARFSQWLTEMADGVTNPSNIELWTQADPFTWSSAGHGISFSLTTSQTTFTGEPGTVSLTPADTTVVYQKIRSFLVSYVSAYPEQYGGTTEGGPSLTHDPSWRVLDANSAAAQEYTDHFLLPLQNSRMYLNTTETRCMITGSCGVRSYAPDLAAIIQPSYQSSWATPEALADQLKAWADGSDANGELFVGKDPFSYNNTGSPLNVAFLLKPAGGAVPFNLSAAQMTSVFGLLRLFLIEYVTAHPEAYGGTTNGYSLSIDPTWSSQDAAQKVTGEQYVAKWLDPVSDRHFNLTYKEFARLVNGAQNTRSYLDDLVTEVWNDPNVVSAFANKDAVRQWFLQRADGNPDNIEFCATAASWAHDVGLATYGGSSCNPVSFAPGVVVTNNDLYGTLRSFLVANIDANPGDYGGSAQLGPNINFHPPWY